MPVIRLESVDLNYHVTGRGAPLVLLCGLGMPLQGWAFQVRDLARHFQVIRMDNRGCGGTRVTERPFTIKDMAGDVCRLLDHLGLSSAHVLGISMGGFIALTLAAENPERVKSLVLAHTAPRVSVLAQTRIRLWAELRSSTISPEMIAKEQMLWLFPESAMADPYGSKKVLSMLALGIAAQSEDAFRSQAEACRGFDLESRLETMTAPTLIISSEDDLSIPLCHTLILERLPQVRKTKIFSSAGHVSHLVHAGKFNREVIDFILTLERVV